MQFLRSKYVVTYFLIAVNVLVFTLEFIITGSGDNISSKLEWGANFTPLTLDQPWRILTSAFLHIGIFHLIVNMYSLHLVGKDIEGALGHFNYFIIYLICALGGGLLSAFWNVFKVAAGASGAIFGLFGFHLVVSLALSRQNWQQFKKTLLSFGVYLILIFGIGQVLPFDNAGHLGGLLTGLVCGLTVIMMKPDRWFLSWLVITFLLILGFIAIPQDQKVYFDRYQQTLFVMDSYDSIVSNSESDSVIVHDLRPLGITADSLWSEVKNDSLPGELAIEYKTLKKIIQGFSLQIKFVARLIERESYIYYDSLDHVRRNHMLWGDLVHQLRMTMPTPPPPKEKPAETDPGEVVKEYYDSTWLPTELWNAKYYRLGYKDSLERWNGPVQDYYMSGAIQMKGEYEKDLRNGVFLYYSEDSLYESAGRYSEGFKVGKWEYFHDNGKIMSEVRYQNRSYMINWWNEDGDQMVYSGDGRIETYHSNGVLKLFENYHEGRLDSITYGYYSNGELHFKEFFDDGILVEGYSFDLLGNRFNYDGSVQRPIPEGGFDAFWDYVELNIDGKSDTTYTVELLFDIGRSGKISNVRVAKGSNEHLNTIAVELLKNGPDWIPIKEHGQKAVPTLGWVEITL